MRRQVAAGLLGLGAGWASGAWTEAAAEVLTRADPQPEGLKPGLEVRYVYPPDVRFLNQIDGLKGNAQLGEPLVGFDYPDTAPGQKALTSQAAEKVAAYIKGYIHFEKAGKWKVRLQSNDGVRLHIGGVNVYEHDGRHGCMTMGWKDEYEVPEPGWYELEATWFQRLSTSCLLMEWAGPGEDFDWTPNEAFGH